MGRKLPGRVVAEAAVFLAALILVPAAIAQTPPPAVDNEDSDTLGVIAGGGLDITLSRRIDFRLFQADDVWAHHNLATVVPNTVDLNGARGWSRLVLKLGAGTSQPPMTVACSAEPAQVMAGEPVTVTATVKDVPRDHTVTYSFSAGKVQDNTAVVDTTGMAPNRYTVNVTIRDKKKNGPPVTCSTAFVVNERPKAPPILACSTSVNEVTAGQRVMINCAAQSADNRPLTYSWRSSAGNLTFGEGTAMLDTAALAGPVTVQATVTDDRGLSASSTSLINVSVPPPAPAPAPAPKPQARQLADLAFKARSARLDNTGWAILDDAARYLKRDPSAKAVIIGFFDPATEQLRAYAENLAAWRAMNPRAYLTKYQGLDTARIEIRTGTAGGTRAEVWLLPSGAELNVASTSVIDETAVRRLPAPVPRKTIKRTPSAK